MEDRQKPSTNWVYKAHFLKVEGIVTPFERLSTLWIFGCAEEDQPDLLSAETDISTGYEVVAHVAIVLLIRT